jgi:hypothetical protein
MKKLLTFLIMLVAGMMLFAMPGEFGATSTLNTVEAVPQRVDVFAAVTDVSPSIALAEDLCGFMNDFRATVTNDSLFNATQKLYRQEVNPFLGYSKTAVHGTPNYIN